MVSDDRQTWTLPKLTAWYAEKTPGQVFIQEAKSGTSWTYAEVHDATLRWAQAYKRIGVEAGDKVLAMLSTRVEYWFSWLGLSWIGGVDIPVNSEFKGDLLSHVMRSSAARVMLVENIFLEAVLNASPLAGAVRQLIVVGPYEADTVPPTGIEITALEDFLHEIRPLADSAPPELYNLNSIVYTSGTTGPSKGVMQPWNQLRRTVVKSFPIADFGSQDAFYLTTPTYHQGGKIVPYLAGMQGGRFVFRERFSASEFWPDVTRYECTWTMLVGVMAPFLVAQEPSQLEVGNPLKVALVFPVPPDVDNLKRRFGIKVFTAYGMTEISNPLSSTDYEVTNETAASCGRPVEGCEVRIVDEYDYEVPVGEVGELIVRSTEPWANNMGYYGLPEATLAALGNGWVHTGDAFRRDNDGFYYFVDRRKDVIRRRGENISSFEVEGIINSHPDVQASAAIAVPSEFVEDEIKVYVVVRPGRSLSPADLIEFLIPVMPRFMVPRYIEMVTELPATPTGKVMKAKLKDGALNDFTWDRQRADSGRLG